MFAWIPSWGLIRWLYSNFVSLVIAVIAAAFLWGAYIGFKYIGGLTSTCLGWYCVMQALIFSAGLVVLSFVDS